MYPIGTSLRVVESVETGDWNEVSVEKGDIVAVEESVDDQRDGWVWCVNRSLGPNNGQTGWVPEGVLVADEEPPLALDIFSIQLDKTNDSADTTKEEQPIPDSAFQDSIDPYQADDGVSTAYHTPNISAPPSPSVSPIAPGANEVPPGTKLIVRYDYDAEKADELSLRTDDIVYLLSSPEGGWWRGMLGYGKDSRAGWFPSTMVEVSEDQVQTLSSTKIPLETMADKKPSQRTSWFKKVVGKNSSPPKSGASQLMAPVSSDDEQAASMAPVENIVVSPPKKRSPSPTSSGSSRRSFFERSDKRSKVKSIISDARISIAHISKDKSAVPKDSWKNYVTGEIVDNMSPNEKKRQDCIWELILTEEDYVRDLKMMIENIVAPLGEKKILTAKHITQIFSNIEDIYATNQKFLRYLHDERDRNPVVEQVGDIFLEMIEAFGVYTLYCNQGQAALQKLTTLLTSNKTLRPFLEDCYRANGTKNLDLASFLIKPAQRICKYPLLLKEMIKATDDSLPDKPLLEKALAKIQALLAAINQGSSLIDGMKRMTEIQNSFAGRLNIASGTRFVVREDVISVLHGDAKKPRRLFLFNDMLILARKDWRDKLHLVCKAALKDIKISDVRSNHAHLFEIEVPEISGQGPVPVAPARYIISCNTQTVKTTWIETVKTLIDIVVSSKDFKRELVPRQNQSSDTEDDGDDIDTAHYDYETNDQDDDAFEAKDSVASNEMLERITVKTSTGTLASKASSGTLASVKAISGTLTSTTSADASTDTVMFEPSLKVRRSYHDQSTSMHTLKSASSVVTLRSFNQPAPPPPVTPLLKKVWDAATSNRSEVPSSKSKSLSNLDRVHNDQIISKKLFSLPTVAITEADEGVDVLKTIVMSLRQRLMNQKKMNKSQVVKNELLTSQLNATRIDATDVQEHFSAQSLVINRLESEKLALLRQVDGLQNDVKFSEEARLDTIDAMENRLQESLVENNKLTDEYADDKHKWEALQHSTSERHATELNVLKITLTEQFMTKESKFVEKIMQLESSLSAREEMSAKAETAHAQKLVELTKEMTKKVSDAQDNTTLTDSLTALQGALKVCNDKIHSLERDRDSLERKYATEILSSRADFERELESLNNQVKFLRHEILEKNTMIADKDSSVTALSQQIATLEERIVSFRYTNESTQKLLDNRTQDLLCAQLLIQQRDLEVGMQKHVAEESQRNVEVAENVIQELRDSLSHHEEQIANLSATLGNLDQETRSYQTDAIKFVQELKNLNESNVELDASNKKLREETERLLGIENELNEALRDFSTTHSDLQRLTILQQEHVRVVIKLEHAETQIPKLEAECLNLRQQLQSTNQSLERVQATLAASENYSQETKSALEDVTRKFAQSIKAQESASQALQKQLELTASLEVYKTTSEKQIEGYLVKLRAAVSLKKKWKESETEKANLVVSLREMQDKVERKSAELQRITDDLGRADNRSLLVDTQVKEHHDEISRLVDLSEKQGHRIQVLDVVIKDIANAVWNGESIEFPLDEAKLVRLTQCIHAIDLKRQETVDELQISQDRCVSLDKINSDQAVELQKLIRSVGAYEHKLSDLQLQYEFKEATLTTQNDSLFKEIQHHLSQLNVSENAATRNWVDKLDKAHSQYQACQKELAQSKKIVEADAIRLDAVTLELDKRDEEILYLRSQLRIAANQVVALRTQVTELVRNAQTESSEIKETEQLRATIKTIEDEKTLLQDQIKRLSTKLTQHEFFVPSSVKSTKFEKNPAFSQSLPATRTCVRPTLEWTSKMLHICFIQLSRLKQQHETYDRKLAKLMSGNINDDTSASTTLESLQSFAAFDNLSESAGKEFSVCLRVLKSELQSIADAMVNLSEDSDQVNFNRCRTLEHNLKMANMSVEELRHENMRLCASLSALADGSDIVPSKLPRPSADWQRKSVGKVPVILKRSLSQRKP